MTLNEFFDRPGPVALAFSGGVDSALLLYAGARAGCDIRPSYVKTAFQPQFELDDARRLCGELGVALTVLELDILAHPAVTANPADRCYHCKRRIFSAILEAAKADGCTLVVDGTNASDDAADRPGMRALAELAVRSPLRECGLSKADVRRLSREAGLFTWDKSAYACLATRIPTGTAITAETLAATEAAETALSAMGFSDFRVRMAAGGAARIQLREGQLPLLLERREEVLAALRPHYAAVTLDLEPRT